ncbi:MAG: hypothetical protein GY699_02740 [Desulfobacteraceae bacterium]|nr:hypothetical protein [Desulfobacteraceae bacterium]
MMKRKWWLILLFFIVLSGAGCQKNTISPHKKSKFERNIDTLIADTVGSCRATLAQIAPAAVISGNVLNGKPYTGLDELIRQRLIDKLSENREIIELSRENWFEIRESRPITFKGHSSSHADLVEHMVVFIIDVQPMAVFDQVTVSIKVKNSMARPIPGIKGQVKLNNDKNSPAAVLLKTIALENPLPKGLENHPYTSMEQIAYSLASELSYEFERGARTGTIRAMDEEIQVVLCSNNFLSPDPWFKQALIKEFQQALVAMDGVTSAVSRDDFSTIFSQMDFYRRNDQIFEMDNEKLKPGSVLLMTETKKVRDKHQVALRAVWRVTPLKDTYGNFIPNNTAGTYVSGFTSRAWFKGEIPAVSSSGYIIKGIETKPPHPQYPDKGFD